MCTPEPSVDLGQLAAELATARRERDDTEAHRQAAEEERDQQRARADAAEAQLAVVAGQRDNHSFRAAIHADTLMQVMRLVESGKDPAALGEAIRAVILQGRSAIVERNMLPAPRPAALAAVAPASVLPMQFHYGLSKHGNDIEQKCPCPLMPCGLVLDSDVEPACPHHGHAQWAVAVIRQMHPHQHCPAVPAASISAGV